MGDYAEVPLVGFATVGGWGGQRVIPVEQDLRNSV